MKELFIKETGEKRLRVTGAVTLLAAVLFLLVFVGCAPAKIMDVDKSKPWAEVRLSIDKSNRYAPTFAIWVEDLDSGETAILYTTQKAAKGQLKGRPGALPVWSGVMAKSAEAADAVSSATPTGASAVLDVQIPEKFKGRRIAIYVEANVSFDYNGHYREGLKSGEEGYSDVNGQPSVLWRAEADTAAEPSGSLTPMLIGQGDVLGADDDINEDMANVTTAADLLSGITIQYHMDGQ